MERYRKTFNTLFGHLQNNAVLKDFKSYLQELAVTGPDIAHGTVVVKDVALQH
jgi:hypothetical protein